MYITHIAIISLDAAMKLYIYRGLDGEKVPEDSTHVIIDDSVEVIKEHAFHDCRKLVSIIMGDNVKIIEEWAFSYSFSQRHNYQEFYILWVCPSRICQYERYCQENWKWRFLWLSCS